MSSLITPLILTYNEAANIQRTLSKLCWAQRIVVIDSYSTDETLKILRLYPQVEVFQRPFDSFASQCNFGLEKIISDWVLSLDADYVLTDLIISKILSLNLDECSVDAFYTEFKYCVFGKPLRGTLLPPRCVLYRRHLAHYVNDGHAHRVNVSGHYDTLPGYIYHDDRKSLSRWVASQDRYMIQEANKLTKTPTRDLVWGDKLRKQKIIAPVIIFFYCLILKGGILDGWHGWYYALQRVFAELLLSIRLIEMALLGSQHELDE